MARVKKRTPDFVTRLLDALAAGLKSAGVRAKVSCEPVPSTNLYRFAVLSPQFKQMQHSERQNLVWRIAERALSPDELLLVSMILTLTPEQVAAE